MRNRYICKRKSLRNSSLNWAIVKVCVIITVALTYCCSAAADIGRSSSHRLAILSSEAVQESGLADLLTVQIQTLAGVELVERDMLQKVLDEVALSMLLGADQPQNRRKAGALLKADMLVLLSLEEASQESEDKKKARLVISDCSNGARLRIGWVLFDDSKLDDTCRDLMKIVNETLERFRDGVKQIIGVSHFVSRNLVHDYDHLQAGYAYLLENALSLSPGVAVIETEEAQSIRQEGELTAGMEAGRVVPLFVEGEFRVLATASERQKEVALEIKISDSTAIIKQFKKDNLPMADAASFITDNIARQILKLSKSPAVEVLDREKQFVALVTRADEFSKLGGWEHSIGLREAAVLLKPDSVKQRIDLIDEYHRMKRLIKQPKYSFEKIKHNKWCPSFQHLEYVIRNRMIDMKKAIELSKKSFYRVPASGKSHKRDFLLKTYPEILKLKLPIDTPHYRKKEYQQWYDLLARQLHWKRLGSWVPDKNELNFWLDLHDRVLPDDFGPSGRVVLFLKDHVEPGWREPKGIDWWYFPGHPEYFSEQDFLDFISAMSRSKKPLASFYGRYALLLHEYYVREEQNATMDDLYDNVELLADEIKEHKFSILGTIYRHHSHLHKECKSLQQKIEQYVQKRTSKVTEVSDKQGPVNK